MIEIGESCWDDASFKAIVRFRHYVEYIYIYTLYIIYIIHDVMIYTIRGTLESS